MKVIRGCNTGVRKDRHEGSTKGEKNWIWRLWWRHKEEEAITLFYYKIRR